jgi:predicted metalloprotease with PDZ domain
MRKIILNSVLFSLLIISCKTDKKQLQTAQESKKEESVNIDKEDALNHTYVIAISKEQPRLAKVSARLHPDENLIKMNEFNEHGLKNGWATFVENVQVTDRHGRPLNVIAKENSQWELPDYKEGPVNLSYQVKLGHDLIVPAIKGGDNGAAYANDDGVMWAGRALFIGGMPTTNIGIRFELPKSWKVTTQWEKLTNSEHAFKVDKSKDLFYSAFFAGTHKNTELITGNVSLRIAMSGIFTEEMSTKIKEQVEKYFEYYGTRYRSPLKAQMILIMGDRDYGGGEVMGKAISISLSPETKKEMAVNNGMTNNTSRLIAHELFHSFAFDQLEVDDTSEDASIYEWFNEGFGAEYGAFSALVRTGVLTEVEFLDEIVYRMKEYQTEVDGTLTLVTSGNDKFKYSTTVYWGGLMAAISLDFLIRDETNGEKNIDDLWVNLLKKYPKNGEALTLPKIYDMSLNLYGKNIADAFKEYTNTPIEIPFFDNSKLMGLTYENDIMVKSANATERQKKLWLDFLQK